MKITVLGTGMVGRTLAARLDGLGHDIVIGTRDPEVTRARTEPNDQGLPPFSQWIADYPTIALATYADAGAHGEIVLNATLGDHALTALNAVGAENLKGKVLLDISVPLDFSEGMPPMLSVANTDSLAEQIQRAFPEARVVKSLNSVFCEVMVDPSRIPGNHSIFVAGDDEAAKRSVRDLLSEFGWPEHSVIDLGDISGARGAEMYARLFFQLTEVLGTFDFNISVVQADS